MQAQPETFHATTDSSDIGKYALIDALSLDPRPTWIVDVQDPVRHGRPVFWNRALANIPELFDPVMAGIANDKLSGNSWTSFVVDDRWKVIATHTPPTTATVSSTLKSYHNSYVGMGTGTATTSTKTVPTLTQLRTRPSKFVKRTASSVEESITSPVAKVNLTSARRRSSTTTSSSHICGASAFVEAFRNFDWASTELGEIETWPQQLIDFCNLMLASPDPVLICWGTKTAVLYNESVVAAIGDRHPSGMGQNMRHAFPEIWNDHLEPLFESIFEKDEPWVKYHDSRVGCNSGRLEEFFWNFTFTPILNREGTVIGTWGTLQDVTTQMLGQRRIATLLRLTASMNASHSFDAIWSALTGGFDVADRDVSHLLVYTAVEPSGLRSGPHTPRKYKLSATRGHDSMTNPYHEFEINDDAHQLATLFKQTLDANLSVCFDRADTDLSAQFWNAFTATDTTERCHTIIVIPICPIQQEDALAFLVVGLTPFVRYNQEYQRFLDLARKQVSLTMTSILLREEDMRRQRLVAEEASAQLDILKAEAELHEMRFKRLAETAPIGICTYAGDGSLTYANDVYRHIFGMTIDDDVSGSDWWAHLVHPEDLIMAQTMFGKLLLERTAVTFEIRVKASSDYKGTPGPEGYIFLLVSAYAEPTGVGPQTVIACFTDINERKRAEDHQSRRLEDVLNAKRQQEAFIDMTSHEIRNPLSVVLHCSEDIISTCTAFQSEPRDNVAPSANVNMSASILGNILDAAETIVFCTLHQKRIVDDILTLSKLESDLLPVTPDSVQSLNLIDGIMKLFEREIRKCDMEMEIKIDPTFKEHGLSQALLDPSRISQIIINLISNAIKFTKTQTDRRLEILLGASKNNDVPHKSWPVSYIPRQLPLKEGAFSAHWSASNSAHLHVAVIDTGAGMSDDEQQKIFSRFTQASPRTHVKYGGSGLGLFICRALSETHGGQIGCKSVPGKGSAFGFHVEVGKIPQMSPERNVKSKPKPSRVTSSSNFRAVPDNSAVISSSTVITATNPREEEMSQSSKFHVLVVEDNILNQRVLRRQLEKAGNSVAVAHHGQDALDQLQQTRSWVKSTDGKPSFDFILMDVEMPVMNGLVCTQRIREFEHQGLLTGHVPIIATTGNARDEHTGLALSAGMDQVVLKPYSLSVLLPIAQKLRQQYGER